MKNISFVSEIKNQKKVCIKYLLLNLIVLSAFSVVYSQAKPDKPPRSAIWKTVTLEKWGIKSFELPETLTKESESEIPGQNKDISWITRSKRYYQTTAPGIEVDFTITEWNSDFPKITGLPPEYAAPENLVAIGVRNDSKTKTPNGIGVNEIEFYELDNLKGSLSKGTLASKRLRLIWQTYRYLQDKSQRISVTIDCSKTDMETAMRVINSLKLQK